MAEEQQGQEKTEEPSQRKLTKAKEEGQIARSRELNSVAIVLFGAVGAFVGAEPLAVALQKIATGSFSKAATQDLVLPSYLSQVAIDALFAFLPFAIPIFLAGIFSSIVVGGMVLSAKAIAFKASRMSPIKGLGRMFSMKALMELAKSIAKFLLISSVAVLVLYSFLPDLLQLSTKAFEVAFLEGITYVGVALIFLASSLIIVAAIDIPFQIQQHKKQLRMTKQEVKEEFKDSDGKPEVKAKVRALQQEISQRKMMEDVPTADVVITNPEHFSVAIKYDSENMFAPMLVAKGVDIVALRIREVAAEHDIPCVPVPVLARAIYWNTEIQQEVPEELYVAVAQVLAYVYQLEQYQRGQISDEPRLANIEVPEGMETR